MLTEKVMKYVVVSLVVLVKVKTSARYKFEAYFVHFSPLEMST